MRLATPLYNMEAGAKSTVELRSNDEREHRGTEVDAPHRSWPPSSFLRNSTVPLHLHSYHGSTGARCGTKPLCWLELLGENLSTLAQDAILSAPDELDRLSRRFDATEQQWSLLTKPKT